VQDRVVALLRFAGNVGNLSFSQQVIIIIIKLKMKWWKGIGDRAEMWYGYWWV
jgi:hypothetical protein